MIGSKWLPCRHQRVRIPDEEPGEHMRKCTVCKRTFFADVDWSVYWAMKMHRPTLVLRWVDENGDLLVGEWDTGVGKGKPGRISRGHSGRLHDLAVADGHPSVDGGESEP